MDYLLDASAVLAFLQAEPGSGRVREALPNSAITSVNALEVLGVLIRGGFSPAEAIAIVNRLHIPVIAFTYACAQAASSLLPLKTSQPLSLGDRACLGAALENRMAVLTAERHWSELDLDGTRIEIIR